MSGNRVGIEAIAVHIPKGYLDLGDLAKVNGVAPDKYYVGLGCRRMAVPAPEEDPVTLAAQAARTVLRSYEIDESDIGLLAVGTESGVDAAKPIASYLHRMVGLHPDCRSFDIQHACYGATAALRMAATWVLSGQNRGRKALVVATDIARYDVGSPGEPTQGAAAVAMIVSDTPRILSLGLQPEAVYTAEVMDFWRPNHRSTAVAAGHYSIKCYMAAVEPCCRRFEELGDIGLDDLERVLYHAPFPKMARKAHGKMLEMSRREEHQDLLLSDYEKRVVPALWLNCEVGNAYSASLYVSLVGLLERDDDDLAGTLVGLFSYGSGCCAELFTGRIGEDPEVWRHKTGVEEALAGRTRMSHSDYLAVREATERLSRGEFDGGDETAEPVAFCGVRDEQRVYRVMPTS